MCLFYPDPAWAILGKCVELRKGSPLGLSIIGWPTKQTILRLAARHGKGEEKEKKKAHANNLVVFSYWSYCKVPRRLRLYVWYPPQQISLIR